MRICKPDNRLGRNLPTYHLRVNSQITLEMIAALQNLCKYLTHVSWYETGLIKNAAAYPLALMLVKFVIRENGT